ncbi:MAG: thermostable hemolysin [Mariprofundaceae bacterium]
MIVDVLETNHAERDQAEKFIHDRFGLEYSADIRHFMPHLIRVRDHKRRDKAIMGYRDAGHHRLFLEVYLDEPVEVEMSDYLGYPVSREHIVEVGNLAEVEPGDARLAIISATAYLYTAGYRWVVFTGVTKLRNAFRRMGLEPKELMEADLARLSENEKNEWGSYYQGRPVVCFGEIKEGYDNLQELWAMLRDSWASAVEAGEKQARKRKS